MSKKKFTEILPDLSKSPVPYPKPKDAGEVCANRLAALNTGALKKYSFPNEAPTPKAWAEAMQRIANLENESTAQEVRIKKLESSLAMPARHFSDSQYKNDDE
jgi:hypothetical protein